jgi:hypothetical protein
MPASGKQGQNYGNLSATSTSGVALKVWRGLTPTLIMTMLVLGHLMLEL